MGRISEVEQKVQSIFPETKQKRGITSAKLFRKVKGDGRLRK